VPIIKFSGPLKIGPGTSVGKPQENLRFILHHSRRPYYLRAGALSRRQPKNALERRALQRLLAAAISKRSRTFDECD
jgi:hypothetical protein